MARFIASKLARLPTLIDPRVMPGPASNRGSSPVPDGDRLAPIRLICPPTANVCSDIAIVPGPPISTTQSTPRPSVSSRTFASQSGVSVLTPVHQQLRRWVGLSAASHAVDREPAIAHQLSASDVFGLVGRQEQRS